MSKIFHKNGQHIEQERVKSFYGNSLFASDNMVNMLTSSRKDDLESLMYIICFLYTGTLPVIEFINRNIEAINMSQFLREVLKFRQRNKDRCHQRLMELLPNNFVPAFQYISNLPYDAKPDYNLIRLWFASNPNEEKLAFKSKLHIKNNKIARDILYDNSAKEAQKQKKKGRGKKKEKKEEDKEGEKPKVIVNDLNKSFEFDADCDEMSANDRPLEVNFRKVDSEVAKQELVRKLVQERQDKIDNKLNLSQSSKSNGDAEDGQQANPDPKANQGFFRNMFGNVMGGKKEPAEEAKKEEAPAVPENEAQPLLQKEEQKASELIDVNVPQDIGPMQMQDFNNQQHQLFLQQQQQLAMGQFMNFQGQ